MAPFPIVHASGGGGPDPVETIFALRAQVGQMERERDAAVRRAERAEERAAFYHTAYHRKSSPNLHQIGGH